MELLTGLVQISWLLLLLALLAVLWLAEALLLLLQDIKSVLSNAVSKAKEKAVSALRRNGDAIRHTPQANGKTEAPKE